MKRGLVFAAGLTVLICTLAGCGRESPDTFERVGKKGNIVVAASGETEGDAARQWAADLEQEVIRELGSRLGVEVVYEYMEDGEKTLAVDEGRADIAAGAVVLEDSGNDGYSVTYGFRPVYIAAARGNVTTFLGELADLSVGIGPDVGPNVLTQLYSVSGIAMTEYENGDLAAAAIEQGTIDGYICGEREARELMAREGLSIQELPGIRQESYAFYAGKDQYRILGELNRLLTEKLKD